MTGAVLKTEEENSDGERAEIQLDVEPDEASAPTVQTFSGLPGQPGVIVMIGGTLVVGGAASSGGEPEMSTMARTGDVQAAGALIRMPIRMPPIRPNPKPPFEPVTRTFPTPKQPPEPVSRTFPTPKKPEPPTPVKPHPNGDHPKKPDLPTPQPAPEPRRPGTNQAKKVAAAAATAAAPKKRKKLPTV